MELKKTRGRKWKIRKEALGFYFILVLNFWMACYEVIAPTYVKNRMTINGYDLFFPIVIGLPWVVIAIKQKNKWAWVRSVLVVVLAYAARALTVNMTYGLLGRNINMFMLKHFHKSISFRMDWIANVTYLVLLTLVAYWIYRDELKVKNKGKAIKSVKPLQETQVRQEGKPQVKVRQDIVEQLNDVSKEENILEDFLSTKTEKLDINQCSESEFMTLPGISLLSAKKAVEERETKGSYRSFDDFVSRNGIKPHFMVQMMPLVMVTDIRESVVSNNEKKARTLDL